jgi:uncharacterized protein YaiL (DUF2058 family)
MASLQEQLLQAGMVDSKKAKQIEKDKRKKARQVPKGQEAVNEAREQARQALAEKVERDREINRQQQAVAEQKAIAAQIKQLIDMNRIDKGKGDSGYQFADDGKIKKINVKAQLHEQLSKGRIAIVRAQSGYELVPIPVADKISQRDASCVLVRNDLAVEEIDEDDPYADYKIPDDLMW